VWPGEPPPGVDPVVYQEQYAGQLERQRHLHIVTADVTVRTRGDLIALLQSLTRSTKHQMLKTPPDRDHRDYDRAPVSRRVTVTVGFGATLFTTRDGADRFDLAGKKPASLKVMPRSEGDDALFRPRDQAADLIILIASDDVYVNEYIFGLFYYGKVHPGIFVRQVERGYARPDSREPSGFEDGISNPRAYPPDYHMWRAVYIDRGDPEPDWCVGGCYLGYRKIRRRLRRFFDLSLKDREAIFGVQRGSGERIESSPPTAHAHKMNLKRGDPDLFGRLDDSRRFLRRPYFFNDGLDGTGDEVRGLHHLSFARDLVSQYEWPFMMWAMNKDFPIKDTGLDALYETGGASNIGGGYYFMPRAPQTEKENFGSLFE
jgi:deferrochelatase/peroxidase EfeB